MGYRAYRNLNNGMISIQDMSAKLVVGHCDSLTLKDVKFTVSESGRDRARKEKTRNVHAYAEGIIVWVDGFTSYRGRQLDYNDEPEAKKIIFSENATYNPFIHDGFISTMSGELIKKSLYAKISSKEGISIF